MAKRSIDKAPRLAIAREGSFYGDAEIKKIKKAVGLKPKISDHKQLKKGLEDAATRHAFDDAIQRMPTPHMLSDRFAKIENASSTLLDLLNRSPNGTNKIGSDPIKDKFQALAIKKARRLGENGSQYFEDAITGITQIRRWALRLQEEAEEQLSTPSAHRHIGDTALNQWIVSLAGIFQDNWGHAPGTSNDPYSGKPGGYFFRFVKTAMEPLHLATPPTDHALRSRIRGALELMKSDKNKS